MLKGRRIVKESKRHVEELVLSKFSAHRRGNETTESTTMEILLEPCLHTQRRQVFVSSKIRWDERFASILCVIVVIATAHPSWNAISFSRIVVENVSGDQVYNDLVVRDPKVRPIVRGLQ